jgi:hypothetical protein
MGLSITPLCGGCDSLAGLIGLALIFENRVINRAFSDSFARCSSEARSYIRARRETDAYLIAEKDSFNQSPDFYWGVAENHLKDVLVFEALSVSYLFRDSNPLTAFLRPGERDGQIAREIEGAYQYK